MPSRAYCPECETAFAYSPALLGKTVQCRQCLHRFTVSSPPPDDTPVTAPPTAGALPLTPPPLPARVVKDRLPRPAAPGEAPKAEPPDPPASEEHRPRRRPEPRERTGNAGVLLGLAATFVLGFFVVIAGVIYLLWPSSSKTAGAAAPGPTPAVEAPMAEEPPKRLEDIIRDAPPRAGNAGGGRFPDLEPRPFDLRPRLPVPGGRPPGEMPLLPGGPPLGPPRVLGEGPKFAGVVPLPISPARLTGDRMEVTLVGPVESVAVAGGGRLLLLHSPSSRKVFVFDVSEARVAKEISVPDPEALIAGGMNVFVVYQPGKNVIERWNCDDLRPQPAVKSPFADPVKGMAMGAASNGPLVVAVAGGRRTVHGGCTLAYFGPGTLKEIRYAEGGDQNHFGVGDENRRVELRVSADGTVVTGWGPDGVSGTECDELQGGQLTRHWHLTAPHPLLPGPDGRALFGRGQVLGRDLKGARLGLQDSPDHYVPAVQGSWYLRVRGPAFGLRAENPARSIEIFAGNRRVPTTSFSPVDDVDVSRAEKGLDQTVILVPDSKVLITVAGPKRSKLVLRRVDLK